MIPADVAGTNGIVRDAVERHLLHIEIAVEQKAAASTIMNGTKMTKARARPKRKEKRK